jgi:hypothetical protein
MLAMVSRCYFTWARLHSATSLCQEAADGQIVWKRLSRLDEAMGEMMKEREMWRVWINADFTVLVVRSCD